MGTIFIVGAIVLGIVVWVMLAMVAAILAPGDRTTTFFWLSIAVGPVLGILAAAVASPRDPNYFAPKPRVIAKGRSRYICSCCGAESHLSDPKGYSCWRCDEKKYMVVDS